MHRAGRRIDFSTGQRNIIRIIHANELSAKGPGFEPFSMRSWLTLVSRPLSGPLFSRFHFYPLNTRDDRCKPAERKRIALLTNWEFPSTHGPLSRLASADSVRYARVKPLRISRALFHDDRRKKCKCTRQTL